MNKVSREQFLSLPAGTLFIENSTHGTAPAIKGDTVANGRFHKQVIRPSAPGRMHFVKYIQEDGAQVEFQVLDEVETMACRALIFENIDAWTPGEFRAKVARLIETFDRMPNIRIELPNGKSIMGDGRPASQIMEGPQSVN